MRKYAQTFVMALVFLFLLSVPVWAFEDKEGMISSTEIAFSNLVISKSGVAVTLTNTSHTAIKTSVRLSFFDMRGNNLGYAIFGLREIPGDTYVNIKDVHLNGEWRKCRDAYRISWQTMTYELLY